jgi:phosphatidylglycerol lysyltransferase
MKLNTNFQLEQTPPQIHKVPFLQENKKIIAQFILTVLFIGLGIWFLRHQKAELAEVKDTLTSAKKSLVLIGLVGTIIFVGLQGLMYYASFAALGQKINLFEATILYLKRNFISIFLPAGGISSLAFFTSDIEKKGIPKTQIHFASSIYGFISIFSVIIVSIPAFLFALHEGSIGKADWLGLLTLILILLGLFYAFWSISKRGIIFRWLVKIFPSLEVFIDDLQFHKINRNYFLLTLLFSILVEAVGIAHIYVSMLALGLTPTILASVMAYLIAVIFLIVSPFLRGLGAIEVSTSFLLTGFGYTDVQAISITLLFRFFEFWIPMLMGIISFLYKLNRILMRILPALLIFSLGVVNILSVLKPSTSVHVENLEALLNIDLVSASNYFVLITGIFLFVTSAFLLKGLRTAWWMAISFTILSFLGHLIKGIDFREASAALAIFVVLFITRKEFTILHNRKVRSLGFQTALFSMVSVLVYGFIGFYFLDKVHFNMHFGFIEIIKFTFLNFFIIGSPDLVPADSFARHFLYSINIGGIFSIILLIIVVLRSFALKHDDSINEHIAAKELIFQYGTSSFDYFKTYADKMFFFHSEKNAFIAYRVAGNYAVALEDPVAKNEMIAIETIRQFDKYCNENGLKSIYYGISEDNYSMYESLNKRKILIGYDAIVNLVEIQQTKNELAVFADWSFKIYNPPHTEEFIAKLKVISDKWTQLDKNSEYVFVKGMFIKEEIEKHRIASIENSKGNIYAFMNLIPDYIPGEVEFDLLRMVNEDDRYLVFLYSQLFPALKGQGYKKFRLGFIPPENESVTLSPSDNALPIRLTAEKLRTFIPYTCDRENALKFQASLMKKRFLVFEDEYDLLQLPSVISKVLMP